MTPTATMRSGWPTPPSTTPTPQRVRPGSTPSTRTFDSSSPCHRTEHLFGVEGTPGTGPGTARRADASLLVELGEDLVADVAVGPDVLHVVAVLEGVDHPEHLARAVRVELDLQGGDEGRLGRVVVDAGALQGGAHGHEVAGVADDLEGLAEVVDLLGQAVLGHDHDALAREDVGDAARVGEAAAVTRQRRAHLGGRAVAVVGEALDEDRDAV